MKFGSFAFVVALLAGSVPAFGADYPFAGIYAFEPASLYGAGGAAASSVLAEIREALDNAGDHRPIDITPSEQDLCFDGFMVVAPDGKFSSYFLDRDAFTASLHDTAGTAAPVVRYRKGSEGQCRYEADSGIETCRNQMFGGSSTALLFHQRPDNLDFVDITDESDADALKRDAALFDQRKDRNIDCSPYKDVLTARIVDGAAAEADADGGSGPSGFTARLLLSNPWIAAALAGAKPDEPEAQPTKK